MTLSSRNLHETIFAIMNTKQGGPTVNVPADYSTQILDFI